MQLKRKRSTDLSASTSPFSNNTVTTSGSRQSHSPSPFQSHPESHQAAGVNSRTLKRYRDNRPSEDMIHQKTLQRLYAAQRQGHEVEPIMSAPLEDTELQAQGGTTAGQKSLEAFWQISTTRQSSRTKPGASAVGVGSRKTCEDCDTPMEETQVNGGSDFDMIGSAPFEVIAHSGGGQCQGCGKLVCGLCSLVRNYRVCLGCVGRGWT